MKLGYDYIVIETNHIVSFLKEVKDNHLTIINLKQIDQNIYSFYTPIYQRYIIKKLHLKITKSIGILHYLLSVLRLPHLFFTITFVISLIIYPYFIYDYKVEGTNPKVNKQLVTYLKTNVPYFHTSLTYEQLNKLYDDIKDKFSNQIDYLNIYQNGGILHLEYTNAVNNKKQTLDYNDYTAKKDGVICKMDVKQGNVVVRLNQYVKKGDLLISHLIEGTDNTTKIIPTSGEIYAYTYQRYKVSLEKNNLSKEENFEYLLFKIRSKLPGNVKIDKEKVISYDIIDKKLVLEMQYVFIENIAIKEK